MNTIRQICVVAFAFVAGDALASDPTIDVKVKNGVATLTAKTDAKVVVWLPTAGLVDVVDPELLKDSKTRVVTGKPGSYRVIAIAAPAADKPIWAETTVSFDGPDPGPGPGPGPVPPPVDDLPRRLREAYAAETAPGKRGQLINLSAIYSTMADHAEQDQAITTSRGLLEVLNKVKAGMLADGVLVEMRRILAAETAAAIGPPSNAPLDRVAAAAMFKRFVRSLPAPE